MSIIKQLFAKMRKTREQKNETSGNPQDFKFTNPMKYHKQETLNDSMHRIIKETTTGAAFL